MAYDPPNWTSTTPMTDTRLQDITDALEFHHERICFTFNADGTLKYHPQGLGRLDFKLDVDPATYPGYQGYPGPYGFFHIDFPEGLFAEIITIQVTAASESNGTIGASERNESTSGVDIFAYDAWESNIEAPFAVHVTAFGILASGKIP